MFLVSLFEKEIYFLFPHSIRQYDLGDANKFDPSVAEISPLKNIT